MKVHEYQAKAVMSQFGIPVPKGKVASTPAESRAVAKEIGGRVMVKAQVYAGGRGRAGGIKVADTPEEAGEIASRLLGTRLVTHQTGAEGVLVSRVLVEEASEVHRELYISVLVDSTTRLPLMMASEAGGMEIEEVAQAAPEKIFKVSIDPAVGFQPFRDANWLTG